MAYNVKSASNRNRITGNVAYQCNSNFRLNESLFLHLLDTKIVNLLLRYMEDRLGLNVKIIADLYMYGLNVAT